MGHVITWFSVLEVALIRVIITATFKVISRIIMVAVLLIIVSYNHRNIEE